MCFQSSFESAKVPELQLYNVRQLTTAQPMQVATAIQHGQPSEICIHNVLPHNHNVT